MAGTTHDVIRAAIAFSGLKRSQIADELGVDETTLDRWSKRGGSPYQPDGIQFARLLAITGFPTAFVASPGLRELLEEVRSLVRDQNNLLNRQSEVLERIEDATAGLSARVTAARTDLPDAPQGRSAADAKRERTENPEASS